mgnify:CR=1 FL=1
MLSKSDINILNKATRQLLSCGNCSYNNQCLFCSGLYWIDIEPIEDISREVNEHLVGQIINHIMQK